MLIINKTYCISSDDERSSTEICLNKENGFYNFALTNFYGDKLDLQINEALASEFFTALKKLGNFV